MKKITLKEIIDEFVSDEKSKCGGIIALNMLLSKEEFKDLFSFAKLTLKGVKDDDGYGIDEYQYMYNDKTTVYFEVSYYERSDGILLNSIHYWKKEEIENG